MEFRWNDWNLRHVEKHGVTPAEAERVVRMAVRPFPREIGEGKFLAWGQGQGGRFVQVIYVEEMTGTILIIHARPLSEKEKHLWRRMTR